MKPESNPKLEQWIAVATINLTPTAISSITREITDHYQSSLEKYEARGISSIEAEGLAVRDLGDPEKSANKFTQVYLTRDEEEKLKTMTESAYLTSTIVGIVLYGVASLIPFIMIFGGVLNSDVEILLLIWSITFTVSGRWLKPCTLVQDFSCYSFLQSW